MTKPLSGKGALVTGATRLAGLGAAIAIALAEAGANVGIGYFRGYDREQPWGVEAAEPAELLTRLRAFGTRAVGFEVDLAQREGPSELFALTRKSLGPIDILVNNAAYSALTPVDELTAEALDQHYTVNLRATALLCAAFMRDSSAPSGGRIINLTSGQGVEPMPSELAYAATKGGVEALTRSLSVAVAGRGVTVNAVDRGPTSTGWMDRELAQTLVRHAPMGRLGTPADAARLVAFLASEAAGWITGQVIHSRGAM